MREKEDYKSSPLVNDTLVYVLMIHIKSCTGIISHRFQQHILETQSFHTATGRGISAL